MIVIVSNGKQYSDHRLYFVEAPAVSDVTKVLNLRAEDDPEYFAAPRAKVLGTADELHWFPRPISMAQQLVNEIPCGCSTMPLSSFEEEVRQGWL